MSLSTVLFSLLTATGDVNQTTVPVSHCEEREEMSTIIVSRFCIVKEQG